MSADRRPRAAIPLLAACLAAGCDSAVEATGERWVYSSESLDVALVQVFEQRTPGSPRLRHAVLCRSEATAQRWREAREELWPGWTLVGRLQDVEPVPPIARLHETALEGASRTARDRLIAGEGWLAWHSASHVDFTFDGCLTWGRFDLAESLPTSDLDMSAARTTALPDTLRIANLEVNPPSIAFTAYSPLLAHTGKRHVRSVDGGRTWSVVR